MSKVSRRSWLGLLAAFCVPFRPRQSEASIVSCFAPGIPRGSGKMTVKLDATCADFGSGKDGWWVMVLEGKRPDGMRLSAEDFVELTGVIQTWLRKHSCPSSSEVFDE